MSQGSTSRRVSARGFGGITASNILVVNLLGRTERGFTGLQKDIFNLEDYRKHFGGYDSVKQLPYVMKTLHNTLFVDLQGKVEYRICGFQAPDAVQATYALLDQNPTPQTLFTVSAAKKGVADKSAFGNKIAIKTELAENLTFFLASDMASNGDTAVLTSVENLKVGYKLHLDDDTNSVYRQITAINTTTKTVTLSSGVGVGITFTAAQTSIFRVDWKMTIGTKREKGNIEIEETWTQPMFKGNTDGMVLATNDVNIGSYYVSLAYNAANTSPDDGSDLPKVNTAWQFLTGGADGTAPNDNDWNTLVAQFADSKAAFLLAPESTSTTHNLNMTAYATNGQKFVYYANIPTSANYDILSNLGAQLRSQYQFAMIPGDKRFKTIDPVNDEKLEVSNVGYWTAHWFNYYSQFAENKVAAGRDLPLNTTDEMIDNGIRYDDQAGNGVGARLIEVYSVNISGQEGSNIYAHSARTLATDGGYQWQHQLMTFLIDRNTIVNFDKTFEQAVGGAENQERRRKTIDAYLRARFAAGIYYNGFKSNGEKVKFEEVVILQLDGTNNPLSQLQTGKENVFYQFIAPYVIENPNLDIASAPLTYVQA